LGAAHFIEALLHPQIILVISIFIPFARIGNDVIPNSF